MLFGKIGFPATKRAFPSLSAAIASSGVVGVAHFVEQQLEDELCDDEPPDTQLARSAAANNVINIDFIFFLFMIISWANVVKK